MINAGSLVWKSLYHRPGACIWIFAAIAAFCGHVTLGAVAFSYLRDDQDDDDLGAPAIEVSVELASPRTPVSDQPPGPESEASAASRAAVQQRTTQNPGVPKEIPKDTADADRQVTTTESKTPNHEKPETKISNAAEDSVAQKAAAAPAIPDALIAPLPAVHDQGTGQSKYRSRVTWQKELLAHLDKFKHYPADRSGRSAEITISMTLDHQGRVLAASIMKSSGDSSFDQAALSMVEKANPVPPPPPLIANEGLNFSLPVIFQKSGR